MERKKASEKAAEHMEDEMAQAQRAIESREAQREKVLKAKKKRTPIATPGTREPGTPRATPKRFGI